MEVADRLGEVRHVLIDLVAALGPARPRFAGPEAAARTVRNMAVGNIFRLGKGRKVDGVDVKSLSGGTVATPGCFRGRARRKKLHAG